MAGTLRDRRAALAAILLLALGLRLAGLGDTLSADEGYTWLVASAPDAGTLLDRLAAYENTPPLLYLLLAPLPLDDEVWLRLPVLIASIAQVAVLYAIVRPLLGTRAALLAAALLAVAPYHVSFANYSRAFMLAGLGILLAVWAAARLAQGGRRRWWWLYAAGAAVALYSEYDAGLALAALAGALLLIGTPPRRETIALAAAPALVLLPWLGQMTRGLDMLDETKVSPVYPGPSPAALRDVTTPLVLGEHGAADGALLRTLEFLVIAAVLTAAGVWLWRSARTAFWLLAGTALGTLGLAALTALAGPDVFAQRYLTVLIPLGAGVLGGAVDALARLEAAPRLPRRLARVPWRLVPAAASLAILALAVAVVVTRTGRELEPDPQLVKRAALSGGVPAELRTNSATVAYYLRDLGPVLDRPFGLDAPPVAAGERPDCAPDCGVPVIVDDRRVAGGARSASGGRIEIGPIVVQAAPKGVDEAVASGTVAESPGDPPG